MKTLVSALASGDRDARPWPVDKAGQLPTQFG